MQQKFAMNKALEQKLIGPMEESHTKQQSHKEVLWMELWARRSKIAAKWARTRAWAGWWFFGRKMKCVGAGISGRGPPWAHETGGHAQGEWARPVPRGPTMALLHLFLHPHTPSSSHKTIIQLKLESKLILLPFSISLLKAPLTKLLWGIVPWYVTPPMVQLVFFLVLYLLQIFAAQVTLFLSLHVKFIWSKVVLMHDIASRHL